MTQIAFADSPHKSRYDVVIVGGAMYGSSVAWFLANNPDFDGSILVVERDPSYSACSTAHTNSCMRQQFSREINVRISQFAADFVKNFRQYLGNDPRVPALPLQSYGYMYLADNEAFAGVLRESQKVQASCGAGTRVMSAAEIKHDYPFYNVDDIVAGSHNLSTRVISTALPCLTGGDVRQKKKVLSTWPTRSSQWAVMPPGRA